MRLLVWQRDRSIGGSRQAIVDPHSAIDGAPWAMVARERIDSPVLATEIRSGVARIVVDSRPIGVPGPSDRAAATRDAARSLEAWGPAGRRRLQESLERVVPLAEAAGITVCIVPHASGLVSDIPTCVDLLRRWSDAPVGLILDPAALVTRSMAEGAEDHLDRIAESLVDTGRIVALLVREVHDDELARLTPATLVPIARRAALRHIPVVIPSSQQPDWTARLMKA